MPRRLRVCVPVRSRCPGSRSSHPARCSTVSGSRVGSRASLKPSVTALRRSRTRGSAAGPQAAIRSSRPRSRGSSVHASSQRCWRASPRRLRLRMSAASRTWGRHHLCRCATGSNSSTPQSQPPAISGCEAPGRVSSAAAARVEHPASCSATAPSPDSAVVDSARRRRRGGRMLMRIILIGNRLRRRPLRPGR